MKKARHAQISAVEDGIFLSPAPDLVEKRVEGASRWKTLYKQAMLELDSERVKGLVVAALEEVARRSRVLERHRNESLQERQEIAEAVAALKYWQQFHKSPGTLLRVVVALTR